MRAARVGTRRALLAVMSATALESCGGIAPLSTLHCPDGRHDGGRGTCVPNRTCSTGYFDDGSGNCRPMVTTPGTTDTVLSAGGPGRIDMVLNIDNGSCGCSKVDKLSAQVPRLFAALQDPVDRTFPDIRVAIIDGDLGTGGSWAGLCASKTLADGTYSPYGDLGRFQMLTSPSPCTVNAGAEFLEYRAGRSQNYTGDINTVLACLISNLGGTTATGCAYQSQLQAFEFALVAAGIGNEKQQAAFLRRDAILALIFLTQEDDCSAAPMDGIFTQDAALQTESTTLRCATRAHECGGVNLSDAPPGYPAVASYSHPFSDCHARTDACSSDTNTAQPTDCSPLRGIKAMADNLKALKDDPSHQILAAGIFGWPLSDADMATAEYKIAPVPNPNTADTQHPTRFEYWPVCYEPGFAPKASTSDANGYDATAWGRGAQGGLRDSAFLDEFGPNGLKFSVCQSDFADTMTTIGARLRTMLPTQCFDSKLADTDPATDGAQPECSVFWLKPLTDSSDPSTVVWQQDASPLPQCPAGATASTVTEDCWRIVSDFDKCPTSGQRLEVLRPSAEIAQNPTLPAGTKLRARCRTCPDAATANCS